jgi:hypothetical protein
MRNIVRATSYGPNKAEQERTTFTVFQRFLKEVQQLETKKTQRPAPAKSVKKARAAVGAANHPLVQMLPDVISMGGGLLHKSIEYEDIITRGLAENQAPFLTAIVRFSIILTAHCVPAAFINHRSGLKTDTREHPAAEDE